MMLYIDGTIAESDSLAFLAQEDPVQPTKTYRLEITEEELLKEFQGRKFEDWNRKSTATAFDLINSVLSFSRRQSPELEIHYLAHTIDYFDLNEGTIICQGLCSIVDEE